MREEIFRNVPQSEVDELVEALQESAIQVTKHPEPGGTWTVVAIFPDPADSPGAQPAAGPAAAAAAPAVIAGPAVGTREVAIDTLARTIWGEARGEQRLGKEAVAAVVLNRLRRGPATRFGGSVEEVCRMAAHFSCWNSRDVNRPQLEAVDTTDPVFVECLEIAARAVDGTLADPTDGADHYHTVDASPWWSRGKTPSIHIGRHVFFNDIA